MNFPQYPKQYDQEVIITPQQHFLAEKRDYLNFTPPKSVILCFEASIMDHYRQLEHTERRRFWTGEMIYLKDDDKEIAIVGHFGIGGPAAAHMLEILITAGVKNFVVVGHAGGLQPSNPIGKVILIDKAVRDEGVSHHYLSPEKYVYSTTQFFEALEKGLRQDSVDYAIGSSWTLDSMYRETKGELSYYAQEGVATVEMELASLFAVASFRKVAIGALMIISDYVSFEKWEEHLHAMETSNAIFQAINTAKRIFP